MERGSASRPTSMYSQTSTESCCSVADSKREMRDLMSSFIADVQRIRETLDDADSAADAAPAVRSADDDVDMAQPVPGAYEVEPATPAEDYEHKGIWCDSCNQKVFGTRHKCLDCYNFDLCNPCYTTKDIQSTHSDMPHTFEAISPPQPKPKAPARPSATKPPSASQIQCLCSVLPRPSGCHICKPHATKDKRSERPVAYKCDACKQLITGTRHRCMTCPDFDLCEACYTAGSPVFAHSPIHRFMHVEHPIRIITAPAMSANSTSPVCAGACVHEGARYKCENCDSLDLCTNCLGDTEKATVEHAAFHAIQEWDQVVRFVPYTKEPKKQPSASSTVSAPVVHAADCDACNKTVIGTRHKCTVCYDFDLCDSCFNHGAEPMNHKSEHEMIHLDHAQRVRVHAVPVPGNTTPVPAPVSETPRPNTIHHAWCDGCSERIRGVRHKCLDCQDFDFCDACRGREHFNGAHQFYALVEPGEVVVRDAFQPPAPPPAIRARGRANPRSMTTPIPIPPPPPVPAPAPRPRPPHHHPHPVRPTLPSHSAACDMCSSRIRGVRYKCTACPDYDVCESCFRLSEDVHPGHSFAKVYNQGDVVVRKSPQDSFRHHARCDVCQNQIIGIRFKCIHPSCPDFDICGRCEAMPIRVHPDTHALIKLRSHISDYDGLKTVLSFTARGETPQPQSATLQVPVVRIPTPRVQIPSPQMPRSPVGGASVEPSTAMDVFHTAAPSPVVPFSTLGCTIVPHTTIVASLPQSPAPEPMRLSPQVVSSPVIPSPPSTVPSPPPIPAALMSHHSEMYKPSYEVPPMAPRVEEPRPMVTKDEVWAARIREIERKRAKLRELKAQREARLSAQASADSVVHPVTVDEERDPEAPQMTLVNDRPVSTMLERTIVPEPVTMTETAATPEPVAIPERAETPKPELPSLLSAYPYQAAERLPIPPAVSISSQEPSPESSISTLSFDTSILNADFVEDRSIVDGQVVSGGAEFAKCWRMRNSGPVAWPNGTTISFVGGDSMLIQPGMIHWAVTGDLSPGQEIDIEVDMKAPEEPGRYTSYWRLKTSDGEAFGARVWCEVVVAELERAGSSGSSVISASSIIVPPYAPGMSAASVSAGTAPVSPTIHSISSTVHTPSIADTADIESLGSVDSDDSDVWEEVRRQTAAAQAQVAARSEADRFEVVYESD